MVKVSLLVLGAVILIAGLWYWTNPKEATNITSNIILFYGRECPHCLDLEKFIEENKIAEKVQFDRLEIFHNSKNRAVLTEKAQICGVDNAKVGVHFLFDAVENKCLMGVSEIENFFTIKAQNQ